MTAPNRARTEMSASPAEEAVPGVTIRKAVPADLEALVALEHAAFTSDRAERRAIRHAIGSPSMTLLVAMAETASGADVLVGAATLERRRGAQVARLSSIAIAPSRWGHGLGQRLLEAAEHDTREQGRRRLRLEVREGNRSGIRLYERNGYRRYTVKPDYYEDGTTAWCYEKTLSD